MDFEHGDSAPTGLDALNRVRTERALEMMSQYGQHVFHVLLMLLHYHHPLLPGLCALRKLEHLGSLILILILCKKLFEESDSASRCLFKTFI